MPLFRPVQIKSLARAQNLSRRFQSVLPWIVLCWSVVVFILALRLLLGFASPQPGTGTVLRRFDGQCVRRSGRVRTGAGGIGRIARYGAGPGPGCGRRLVVAADSTIVGRACGIAPPRLVAGGNDRV